MLSICIPSYNFDLRLLIQSLTKQIYDLSDYSMEIIVIDDASEIEFRKDLKNYLPEFVSYIQLDKNVGRAKIRNLFLNYAKYDHLFFLDADSYLIGSSFLKNYINYIKEFPNSVFCGGREYPILMEDQKRLLSWRYGIKRESKSVDVRKNHPYNSFMTNNFVIPKVVLEFIKFDERINGYGHEDTLFGLELKKNAIQILHIENPILNGDIETTERYLVKTLQGIENLIKILKFKNFDHQFIRSVKLLNSYSKVVQFSRLISFVFSVSKKIMEKQLQSSKPSILLFNFYKICILNQLVRENRIINKF